MSKHTPGPWEIDDAFKTSIIITNDTDMVICQIHGRGPGATADGRLITAAPDMLEALKLIANAENSALDLAYCKGIARAAITKATGGEA